MKKGDITEMYKAVLSKECENCGIRYVENKKICPRCKTVNLDYFCWGREKDWLHKNYRNENES